MTKERSNQRSASSLPRNLGKSRDPSERSRGGGAGAGRSEVAHPPSPSLPRQAGESTAPPAGRDLVLVGEFGRAHGLKGEVRLKSFTGDPADIAKYRPLYTAQGRALVLKKARAAPGNAPDMLIAEVEGIATREAAEALNRVQLHVERGTLPPPEEEDEFLLADLIGLPVQDEAGTMLGTVVDVPNYGGGDLLDIRSAATGATALLPFTRAFVPVVEIASKRIVIVPPEDFFAPAQPQPQTDPKDEA